MDKVKVWRCKGGHVLGIVVRNGSGVRQLLLYREAVDSLSVIKDEIATGAERPRNDTLSEVDVMAVVEGRIVDVRCSICGRVRTWVPLDL